MEELEAVDATGPIVVKPFGGPPAGTINRDDQPHEVFGSRAAARSGDGWV